MQMTETPNHALQRTPGFGVQLPGAALIRPAQSRAVRPAMKPGTARAFALRRRAHSRAPGPESLSLGSLGVARVPCERKPILYMRQLLVSIAIFLGCLIPAPGLDITRTILFITTAGETISYQIDGKPLSKEEIYPWFKHNKWQLLEVRTDSQTTFDSIIDVLCLLRLAGVETCTVKSVRREDKNDITRSLSLNPGQASKDFRESEERRSTPK